MAKMKSIDYDKELNKARQLCSRSEKCRFDIQKRLINKGLDRGSTDTIVSELVKEGFIDEDRYARSFAHDKFRFNKWGRVKIRTALLQRGLPEDAVNQALEEIEENDYKKMVWAQMAEKKKSISESDPAKEKAKLLRFAQNRGYESGLVFEFIEELINN